MKELELERRLVQKITAFIMELGSGFSFIGNQHTLTFNDKEYRVDLLFFHRRLRSMVAAFRIHEVVRNSCPQNKHYRDYYEWCKKVRIDNNKISICYK